MNETIGFIGLGNLGLPMATNLLKAGYSLRVYNRTASKADPLITQGAQWAARPADAATPGGMVASILWDDASVESVIMSDGFLDQLGQGGVHISMSTITPEGARKLAAIHAEHGSIYIDAPIFGRPEAAAAHQLWIPMAGAQSGKDRARPLLEAMGGQGVFDFGEEVGAGVTVKLIGNYLIGAAAYSMREGLAMARASGVDPKAVIDMLTSTLLNAPIYKSYGQRIAETPQLFTANPIALKDIGLFQQTAQEVDTPTPIAHLLEDIMRGGS